MITFKQFIGEEEEAKKITWGDNPLKTRLEDDCDYFINESSQQGFLIRGMRRISQRAKFLSHPHPRDPELGGIPFWEIQTRTDRQPTDTSPKTHEMLDRWFDRNFGLKARSQALFCSGSSEHGVKLAQQYGEAYIIFPIGKFKYVWSKSVSDLYGNISGIDWHHDPEAPDEEDADPEVMLDKFMTLQRYTSNRLDEAVQGRSEIMVGCSKYYAFEYKWRPALERILNIA